MGDYSPPARPGYTRTGKSLKAVRRYYAMQNKNRTRRSPASPKSPNDDEDRDRDRERNREREREKAKDRERERQRERDRESDRDDGREDYTSVSKRRHSPDDDKLSKRIAAELRVQQEANEKRQVTKTIASPAAIPSALPTVIVQPKEVGPTFITEPINDRPKSAKSAKSAKSTKSVKSGRSVSVTAPSALNIPNGLAPTNPTSLGCVITCLVLAFIYIITCLVMLIEGGPDEQTNASSKRFYDATLKRTTWVALTSILVVLAVPYWLIERHSFKHTLVCLIFMVISALSLAAYQVHTLMIEIHIPDSFQPSKAWDSNDPVNFLLSMTFLVFLIISIGIMIKHSSLVVIKKIEDKTSGRLVDSPHMSLYLSPN